MKDVIKEIRNSIAHGEKLAEMDFDVEITLGKPSVKVIKKVAFES